MADPQVRRGLAPRPSGLITTPAKSARASGGYSLPLGALGTGLSIAPTVINWFRSRRERRDQLQAALRDANLFNPDVDVSVVDPQFVVGRARTKGIVGPAIDSGKFSLEYATGNDGALLVRFVHTLTLLSGGPLADMERLYVNGVEAPIVGSARGRSWSTTGATRNVLITALPRFFRQAFQGSGPLLARYQDIRARMDALIPGWAPTTTGGAVNIPGGTNTVVEALFNDLLNELTGIIEMARLRWRDDRQVKKTTGGDEEPAGEGVITCVFSFGTDADASPSSIVQSYAGGNFRSRTDGDNGSRPRIEGWRATDTFDGIAFALNRHRFWKIPGDTTEIAPWASVPTLEYVLKGGGDYDGNPAKLARAIFLMSPEPREASDLEGLDAAIARCAELLPVREMAFSDVGGSVPEGQLSWEDYRLLLWDEDALPSQSVQEKVIAEVNKREAGADNAQPRFSMNTVITGSQIESGEALAIAEECMGGRFVELAGKRIAFRPAQPRSAVATIGVDERVEPPTWKMGKGQGQAPNAIEAVLPADHERNFRPSEVPTSRLDAQVERDGLSVVVRQARGQVDNLAALRQNAIILDRDSVDKREGEVVAKVESAADPIGLLKPMDIVDINAPYGNTQAEVQLVQPLAGRVRLVVREIDSDTYEDKYFATPLVRDAGTPTSGAADLWLNMASTFRQTTDGRVCDLTFFTGSDVDTIEVLATWRAQEQPDPPATPIAPVVNNYLLGVSATQRGGSPIAHTIAEQAGPATALGMDPEDEVFEGSANRELVLEMTPRSGTVEGTPVRGILIPSTGTAAPVRFRGVNESELFSDVGRTRFIGWQVTIYSVEFDGDDLVYTWSGGASPATDYNSFSADVADNIHLIEETPPAKGFRVVVRNTYRLQPGQATMTLAARSGAGTVSSPFTYSSGVPIDINKYVRPQDLSHEVPSQPTTPGGFVGQLAYTVEEE